MTRCLIFTVLLLRTSIVGAEPILIDTPDAEWTLKQVRAESCNVMSVSHIQSDQMLILADGTLWLYNLERDVLQMLVRNLVPADGGFPHNQVSLSPTAHNAVVLTSPTPGQIEITSIDLETANTTRAITLGDKVKFPWHVLYTPSGRHVVLSYEHAEDRTHLIYYNSQTWQIVRVLRGPLGNSGRQFLCGRDKFLIRKRFFCDEPPEQGCDVIDVESGQRIAQWNKFVGSYWDLSRDGTIAAIHVHRSGGGLGGRYQPGYIAVFDVKGERERCRIEGKHEGRGLDRSASIRVLNNGMAILYCSENAIHLWDLVQNKEICRFSEAPGYCPYLEVTPDEQRFVLIKQNEGRIRVWRLPHFMK